MESHRTESATLYSVAQTGRSRRDELYEQYLAVPEHLCAEILNGTLHVMSRPAPRHANAAYALGSELYGPFHHRRGGPGGWWIFPEPELQLVLKEPVVPDLAGWRLERVVDFPETACFTIAPDWVCEVLSRSTEKLDRDEKLPYYAEHGVRHVWLVDPVHRRLEVHSLDDDRRWHVQTYRGDAPARVVPFDAVELALPLLWSRPPSGDGG